MNNTCVWCLHSVLETWNWSDTAAVNVLINPLSFHFCFQVCVKMHVLALSFTISQFNGLGKYRKFDGFSKDVIEKEHAGEFYYSYCKSPKDMALERWGGVTVTGKLGEAANQFCANALMCTHSDFLPSLHLPPRSAGVWQSPQHWAHCRRHYWKPRLHLRESDIFSWHQLLFQSHFTPFLSVCQPLPSKGGGKPMCLCMYSGTSLIWTPGDHQKLQEFH